MGEAIRYGIVGCAGIGNTHAKAVHAADGADLVACADVSEEAAAAFAETHEVPQRYGSVSTMIEEGDVDAISICTPSGTHAQIAIEAAEAGAHILCEKPLDVYVERINAMIAACDEAGVTLAGVFQRRFAPELRGARALIASGEFGDPVLGSTQTRWFRSQGYYDSGGWRGTREMDGGALMNQGIHAIDALQWVVGDVESVQAMTGRVARDLECEDTGAIALSFENGAMGTIEVTTGVVGGNDRLEVSATNGSIGFDGDDLVDCVVGTGETSAYQAEITEHSLEASPHPHGEGHIGVVQDFVTAIANGTEPEVPAAQARKAVDIILAAYRSSETGQRIDLETLRATPDSAPVQ